jgi:hypothetical protein
MLAEIFIEKSIELLLSYSARIFMDPFGVLFKGAVGIGII